MPRQIRMESTQSCTYRKRPS